MADKKDNHKEFSTCFEMPSLAEMMRRMMDRQGVGSLCAEMMQKVMGHQKEGCSFHFAEMMQKIIKERGGVQKEPEK